MVLETKEKEYASLDLFKLLKKYKQAGTLSTKLLSRDIWLTNKQAKELGYDVPEDEDFLLSVTTPQEAGKPSEIISPERITTATQVGMSPFQRASALGISEIEYEQRFGTAGIPIPEPKPIPKPVEDPTITLFRRVYTDRFKPESTPQVILQGLSQQARDEPDAFLTDLRERGKSADTIQLLQLFSSTPLTQDIIDNFFQGVPEVSPEQDLLIRALPLLVKPRTLSWATKHFGENPDALRRELITVGRNADTEALVKALYPQITDRGMEDYFSARVPRISKPGAKEVTLLDAAKVLGQAITKVPRQLGASILQAIQGQGGASIVDKDWADKFIEDASKDIEKFTQEVSDKYRESSFPIKLTDIAQLPQNIAYSLTSMGAGITAGVPVALAPVPGARIAAWGIGSAASGAVAYSMTTYQIMQQYLEAMNEESIAKTGRGITAEEEKRLKDEFEAKAREYGLWEAVPEAISNLAFAKILTTPLVKIAGKSIAAKIVGKMSGLYGEELLTETITQKGQSDIEVATGLREGKISWVEAFKEIAPQTFLLTTVLGGAGQISISSVQKIRTSLKKEAGDSATFSPINENINEGIFDAVEAETQKAVPAQPTIIPPEITPTAPTPTPEVVVTPRQVGVTPAPEVTKLTGVKEVSRAAKAGELTKDDYVARMLDENGFTKKGDKWYRFDANGKEVEATSSVERLQVEFANTYNRIGPTQAIPKAEVVPEAGEWTTRTVFTKGEQFGHTATYKTETQALKAAESLKKKFPFYETRIGQLPSGLKTVEYRKMPEAPAVAEPLTKLLPEEQAEAPSPLLSVPEETTLPMPDEVTVSEDRVVLSPPPPKEPPPSEPSPTHSPQPAPIEAGRITMPDLQPPQQVVDLYSKPDFWRRIANLPLVRKAVGLFNPAAVANNPAQQAIILRAALKDEGAQKAQAVMSHLWEIGTQERIWGKTDEMGLLTKEPFAAIPMGDILRNPAQFMKDMTSQQKEWIKRFGEIDKVKLDALKRNGIEINELSFEDGGQYSDRRVMGKFNDAGELIESGYIAVGGRVGARQVFEKTRVFKTEFDGISAGFRYMNSDEALYYNTLGAYFKIADKQMADWILTKVDWRTTAAPEALVLQAEAARLRLRKARQLLAALNRAVRGERVPSNTINSIASVYADQADTLRTLIPELQKPSPETADTVRILDSEAKALISEARLEYYQAVNERARAREEAMRVKYEEASIAHPAFAGKIFTGAEAKEIADILNRGLTPQFIEALGAVNKVNAIGRFFMLAGDASPMAIQLQFLAFYRPAAYAKAMGGFVRAMFDPEFQYRYYANNRDLINRHPTLILSGRGTEFTEFMGRGGLGKKLGLLAKPLVPFQKAFEGSIDVAGIELAKSLDHLATTPERTLEVDQFINEFRGITSSARIGVSSTQRQAETAILLAPRYNRAIAAYLFDIVHGGVRGELARMSLAQGLAGLSAMAVATSIALGEDDDEIWQHFDPRSNKFFTWDVMGVKIGLGGKVRSILKTFGNMLRTGEVGQPALNFLRGNLSPGASTGLDLLTGKNYIGEPTRDNILDFTKTVGRNFMMIWTQGFLMEGGTLKDKAIIATAEFLGLRGYDISAKKELKIKDLEDRLGEQVGKTPMLTKKKPDIYDTRNIFSDVKNLLKNIPPEDVLADKGYAGWGHLVVKIQQNEANTLPNIAFKDYNFDKTRGDTFSDYMSQWAERQRMEEAGERASYTRVKIVEGKEERTTFRGLEALNAHKVDYPNAQRGNLSKRDRELLLEYNAAVDKKQFIKDHPEIKVNKLTEWLKSHPRENAEFAFVGQADILSKEAYNQYKKLIVEMDTPDAALLKKILPPEGSIDNYFKYQDMENKNSWEAQLMLAKDPDLLKFLDRQPIDTPIASLELKVKNRANFDKLDAFSDKDSPDYIADEKKRAEAIKKFKADNPEFVDDTRRIEAIEKGTEKAPTSETNIQAHVDYGKLIDKEGVGSSSSEVMLLRVDNPEYDKWRTDEALWGDNALKPVDRTKIPIWRIDVKYQRQDTEYDALTTNEARRVYLEVNENYRKDRRRRDAYGFTNISTGDKFPTDQVESYVGYMEILDKPNVGSLSAEAMLYRVDNPAFNDAMIRVKGWQSIDESKVRIWRIEVQFQDLFNEYQNILDTTIDRVEQDAKIQELFAENPAFQQAYYRHAGYKLDLSEEHTHNYVTYMLMPEKGWSKERYLKLHPEFYEQIKKAKGWKTDYKWDEIPSEKVENLYFQYLDLPEGKRRQDFRFDNPELDDWLVLTGKVTRSIKEQKRRGELTARERFLEDVAIRQSEFDKRIAELRKKLGGL